MRKNIDEKDYRMVMVLIGSNITYAQNKIPSVIRQDNRHILQSNEFPSAAIGRINGVEYNSTSFCTSTLIAADKIVTTVMVSIVSGKTPFAVPATIWFPLLHQ